jgi:hypothetical protein
VSRHQFAYENDVRSIDIGALGLADCNIQTDVESKQKAAKSMANRATADYHRYKLRSEEASKVEAVPRSEFKDYNTGCPFGERASSDDDSCTIYDHEQVTRCRLNACCRNHAIIDDSKSDSRREKLMNNYGGGTASRLGRH